MYGNTTLYERELVWRYGIAMYHAVNSFSLVEICPRTNIEILGSSIIFLINAMVNANLFGFFADLLATLNATEERLGGILDDSNEAMESMNISSDLRTEVRKYYDRTQ